MNFLQQGKAWCGKPAIASFFQRVLRRQEQPATTHDAAPARKSIRRGMAKVEYLACESTIFQLLAQGFSKRLIHERLTEAGTISMSYAALCQFLREAELDKGAPAAPELTSIDPSTLF